VGQLGFPQAHLFNISLFFKLNRPLALEMHAKKIQKRNILFLLISNYNILTNL